MGLGLASRTSEMKRNSGKEEMGLTISRVLSLKDTERTHWCKGQQDMSEEARKSPESSCSQENACSARRTRANRCLVKRRLCGLEDKGTAFTVSPRARCGDSRREAGRASRAEASRASTAGRWGQLLRTGSVSQL